MRSAFGRVTRGGRLLATLTVVAALAVACRPAPSSGETVLRVMMTDDWADTPPFLAAVKEFEKVNPGVRIEIDKLSIRYMAETVRAQVEDGTPVDVVQWHAYAAGAQGLAEPLQDLWAKYKVKTNEYFPGAVEDVTWNKARYGLPLDTNAMVLFYRNDRFSAANLPPPIELTTFQDLERKGMAVTSPDGSRRAIAFPNSYWHAYGWIRANGGEVLEVGSDGTPRFTLDSPAVIEAVSFLSSMINRGLAFAPVGGSSADDALALFSAGSTALHASGSWDLVKLQKEAPGGSFGVALMPRGMTGQTEGTAMGGSSLFVPKGSKNRELAFRFMQMVTDDRYALRLAKEEGRLPVRVRVFEDPYFQNAELQVFLEQLKSAHPLLLDAFPEASQALDRALNEVLTKGADPAVALHEAQVSAEKAR
jgi:multiple sugar transport system substrate-binding protein